MTKCKICKKEYFCNCKNKKYTAEITLKFSGNDKAEVEKRLKEANRKLHSVDINSNMSVFPNNAEENEYDKAVIEDAVWKLASLSIEYGYQEDEMDEVLDNLSETIQMKLNQYYQELSEEMAYERYKEEQFEKGIENK
jgi:hypothetical protein